MQLRLAQSAPRMWHCVGAAVCTTIVTLTATAPSVAQRVLGLDISTYQGNISQTTWNNIYNVENRQFVFIRASRGGTTGYDHRQGGYPSGNNSAFSLSQRYDDPYFVQNINQATTAGMLAGPYHYARPDIVSNWPVAGQIANSGTDDASHFLEMAGAWMRPGYMRPVFDLESGQLNSPTGTPGRSADALAQFCIDFSDQIYAVMGIRPIMYINGSYSTYLQGSSLASQVASAYPTLWDARYAYQAPSNGSDPGYPNSPAVNAAIQTAHPKDTFSGFYGPWDDNGVTHPWGFWQYASTGRLPSYHNANGGSDNLDFDVSQGDIEYVKDQLVPAVWMNDNSGDWSTLTNWNSGQPVTAPAGPPQVPSCGTCTTGTGQLAPIGTQTLPTPRLPGTAGSGPAVTSGVNDTVILERTGANVTVTLSAGTYTVRKLFMREALDITGGTLTVNYDPNYFSDTVNYPNALRSGPISAQFSGPVSLSGSGSLNVNTLQVDANQIFTLAGSSGALTFKQINLLPSATIALTGDVNINPLSNATATISGSSGSIDLSGGMRIFNVGDGTSGVDLDIVSPITNGGLTKNGAGTMRLSGANTFTGAVTVNAGILRSNNAAGFSSSSVITVNSGGMLDMNGISDTVAALAGTTGTGAVLQGSANLTLAAASGSYLYAGTITGTGSLVKSGAATQTLTGNNTLGDVTVSGGSLLFNGTNSTGAITVQNTATLGGNGAVTGAVTVGSGGHISPGGGIESFDVGSITLNSGSILDFQLNTVKGNDLSDLINVNAANGLTINGGTLNITDIGSMTSGIYTLINYSGTLNGSLSNLTFGTLPGGFLYNVLDTGSAINLSVAIPGDFNLDGMVDGADYIVWQKGLGTTYAPSDYDVWRANYGRSDGSGSGANLDGSSSVPEPTALMLISCGVIWLLNRRRRYP